MLTCHSVLTACFFGIDLPPIYFQAIPWATAITDKVKDMQGLVAEADQMQTRAVKVEEELGRRDKEMEVVSG